MALAEPHRKLAGVNRVVARSQSVDSATERAVSAGESSVPGRLRKPSGESPRRNWRIGVTHRSSPVTELRRGASRKYRCPGQVNDSQSRSEPPHCPQ